MPPVTQRPAAALDPLLRFGRQLPQLRDLRTLARRLVVAAKRLVAPARVLLVVGTSAGREIAGARLPQGESAAALLTAVSPWLDAAAEQRMATLHVGPPGAPAAARRCCIVAPLCGRDSTLGFLYCDVEGEAWGATERDRIALLATQAALALDNLRLAEQSTLAIDHQQASLEVLRAISGSAADTQPVFDIILRSGQRLFGGRQIGINLLGDDGLIHAAAYQGRGRTAFLRLSPFPSGDASGSGAAILHHRVMHYPDAQHGAEVPPATKRGCATIGVKSVIFAPLLWQGRGIGVIFVGRAELAPFSEREIAALQAFAEQAVIAIQNARLFKETREGLAQQTAIAGMLKMIGQVSSDLQPMLRPLVESATRLSEASHGFVFLPDGDVYRLATAYGASPEFEAHIASIPVRPERGYLIGRVVLERRPVQILDALADPDYRQAESQRLGGYRTMVGVPMLSGEQVVGVIVVWRQVVRAFSERQVELLSTFADQAAIAIRNARHFSETQAALERQTAAAEVLQVIASSVEDVTPVFERIVDSCRRLLAIDEVGIAVIGEDDLVRLAVHSSDWPGQAEIVESYYPVPTRKSMQGLAIRLGKVLHYPDALHGERVPWGLREIAERRGNYSVAVAPMIWQGRGIGGIHVTRRPPVGFSEQEVALLETFANQAAIAIQNAKLFGETREALRRQTATGEVLQAIAQSVADPQPVYDRILQSILELCECREAGIYLAPGDGQLYCAAVHGADAAALKAVYPMPLAQTGAAIAIARRQQLYVADMLEGADSTESLRRSARAVGNRALAMTPLIWGGEAIGVISITRDPHARFSDKDLGLLRTFADQAVIAIQNARLVQRNQGGAGTPEGIGGHPDGHQQLGVRCATGFRQDRREEPAPVAKAIAVCAVRRRRGTHRRRCVARHDGRAAKIRQAWTTETRHETRSRARRWSGARLVLIRMCRAGADVRADSIRHIGAVLGNVYGPGGGRVVKGQVHGTVAVIRQPPRRRPFEKADGTAADLCQPGGDRNSERAVVQRDQGGAGTADRDGRSAEA